jgi:beclin 1
MHSKITSLQKQLEKLQKTAIISDIFKIGSVDEIGTIGGYRLGKTQRVDVPWEEINTAIGQLVYLLCVLGHRMGYKFESF